MPKSAWAAIALMGASSFAASALAGDRDGIAEELESISGTWTDALFSIDVRGTSEGTAVLNQRLEIAYDAASPGYLAYLRVSSHGDLTLYRELTRSARSAGTQAYVIKPPLGSEQLIVLFANAPWDALFSKGASTRDLGADRTDAAELVRQLTQLADSHVMFAARRYDLNITASTGGTQYTTRAIVRRVREAGGGTGSVARIPSRIEFEFDSDRLTPQGKLDLDTFGEALVTDLHDSGICLEGHTDAIGTDEYNMALSERRAAAAKQYLLDSFGIAGTRITTAGMGKNNPLASNEDAAGRSQNRRVDFIFSSAAAQASRSYP